MDIKICGLKTAEAIAAAVDGGASHVGFIFFRKSPRYIDPERAGLLAMPLVEKALAVAVTVDADDAALDEIFTGMEPDIFQLHGNESPKRVAEVKARYRRPVMKALSISTAADLEKIQPFVGNADRFLFDAKPPRGSELPGGNGVSFDWTLLQRLDPTIDYMLSGGLNADNIGEAMYLADPPGIDISSGVERAPGVKDVALIEAFFRSVRAARDRNAA